MHGTKIFTRHFKKGPVKYNEWAIHVVCSKFLFTSCLLTTAKLLFHLVSLLSDTPTIGKFHKLVSTSGNAFIVMRICLSAIVCTPNKFFNF